MKLVYMPQPKHKPNTPPTLSCYETEPRHMVSNMLCMHRAMSRVPWESEPRTPTGSPAYGALAADYTSDEWSCDGWQQAHLTPEGHRKAVQPAALDPAPPRPTSGSHGQGNQG